MDLKSISSLTLYVDDLDKTATFYKSLGFRPGNQASPDPTVYVNWFSIVFRKKNQTEKHAKNGLGPKINIKVENVDDFYKKIIDIGLKPSSEPGNTSKDNREFLLKDPDGHNLVFFQKK